MDWSVFHGLNAFVYGHEEVADAGQLVETWGVTLFALATFALWLLDRPGAPVRWRLVSARALASAAVGLGIDRAVAAVHHRLRPYQAHHGVHVFAARTHDASFPSDHASAAFGIAWAVLLCDRAAGALFVAAAAAIAAGRVVVGVHYPADVVAGMLVGLAAALLVARAPLLRLVEAVARVTDPLLAPFWRGAERLHRV